MFAYCGNNPNARFDPNGTGWLSALVSGVVAAVSTLVTGGSVGEAIGAGIISAVGGYFGGNTYRLVSAGYAMVSTWIKGGSFEAGLANGAISYGASWVTGEVMLGSVASEGCQAIVDCTFGAGANITAAAVETVITNNSKETREATNQAASNTMPSTVCQISGGGGNRYACLY